jgi:hypothetical protein
MKKPVEILDVNRFIKPPVLFKFRYLFGRYPGIGNELDGISRHELHDAEQNYRYDKNNECADY